jgi:hypothetical protein
MSWAYVAIVIWTVVTIVGLALVAGGAGADAHLNRLDEQHHAGCDLRTTSSEDQRASVPAQSRTVAWPRARRRRCVGRDAGRQLALELTEHAQALMASRRGRGRG